MYGNEEIQQILKGKKIAYFSMEMGLDATFSTYSGGLGILAGDTVRSSADLKIPLVAVTLVNKKGYFRQELTPQGKQIEHPDEWNPEEALTLINEEVEVKIEGKPVKIKAWLYVVESSGVAGGKVPVFLLDADVEGNTPEDREITSRLYGGDQNYRIKQEIVLGIGGLRLLQKLNVDAVKFHLNEGHASFLLLELLKDLQMDIEKVREMSVFTTHTPIEAGHDKFSYEVATKILAPLIPIETLKELAGQDCLNMTLLALNLSGFINGVAKKHQETTEKMFPSYEIKWVTNGIHSFTWTHPGFKKLYDKYLPGWANEPELLVRVENIPHKEILEARAIAKKDLINYTNSLTNQDLSPEVFTIGFARRATTYKRHTLLFTDLDRLRKINKKYKFQLIFAGKAHPHDEPGKQMIEQIFSLRDELKDEIKIAYLENYDMNIAKKLIPGVDIWLNTPRRPLEASGTSGMKAAHNGVVNLSILDGWWIEGWIEGVTGWAIGPRPEEKVTEEEMHNRELEDLYGKLEYAILPMFYEQKEAWIKMMTDSIGKIAYYFNSHRMMRRYITEAYFI